MAENKLSIKLVLFGSGFITSILSYEYTLSFPFLNLGEREGIISFTNVFLIVKPKSEFNHLA